MPDSLQSTVKRLRGLLERATPRPWSHLSDIHSTGDRLLAIEAVNALRALLAAVERGERLAEAGRAFHALALDHLPLGKQSYEMRQAGIAWRNALAAYEAKEGE